MEIINAPENPTLVLGGEEHVIAELGETAKYYIDQVQDLNVQMHQLKAKLHQIEVSRAGFVSLLTVEVDSENETEEDDN
tara:strand:- start:216 stop:452 length:237 start_codon:yes stop_codon:yes gene_type:complete